jgi:hypothetical protein
MQRSALLTTKVISLLKQGIRFRNIALALRIQHHLLSLESGGLWAARRILTAEEICPQDCDKNPRDRDEYKQTH